MRTKIICSIGPASETRENIEKLMRAGMDIARLNFSHDVHEFHGRRIDLIREINKTTGFQTQILCDLQGPKIRITEFPDPPKQLQTGQTVVLTTSAAPNINPNEIVVDDPYLHLDIKEGDIVLIDDGSIELVVEETSNYKIYCKVVVGGDLYPRKGVNVPLTQTTTCSITDKDIEDLKFILPFQPDWIALSFVQNAKDVLQLRDLIKANNGSSDIRIMCKIERALAVENLDEILDVADGIMVARGDLGVELPFEELPLIQKQLIRQCNYAHKPVVTATHMLASMTKAPFPTRAEVTDIANAVLDGTDAVMLSNETTVGLYPVKAVETMAKIVERTEEFRYNRENKI